MNQGYLLDEGTPNGFDEMDAGASPLWRLPSEECDVSLKESCCACFARFISVLSALAVVLFAVLGVATIVIDGAIRVQEDIQLYEIGARQVEARVKLLMKSLSLAVPEAFLTTLSEKLMESLKMALSSAVGGFLGYAGKVVFELLMLGLYVLFWLCAPMPLNRKTETIFRRYLFLKGTACIPAFHGIFGAA
ncbi:unnamed protein product [Symbiodinium natans]|uniref:Uncharacterized protein n=1 Tax=Symbiodinium natans TaxID=878477 RepID=A0A812LYB5_9DINO|nr:unnamed protein product [Symbiodinium natans]